MLREEREAALPCDVRAGLVVAGALIAIKAVFGPVIDEDLHVRPLGADGLDVRQRNAVILFTEMQLRRYGRLVVGKAHHGAAVIANGGAEAGQLRGCGESNAAAKAEADDADI